MIALLLAACDDGKLDDTAAIDDTATTEECSFLPVGDRLVLDEGCADGLCGGTVYTDAVAILGEPDACTPDGYKSVCAWGDLSADFPDCDADGQPDAEYLCDQFDQTLTVSGAWDGATADGLGLGVTEACWEQVLGAPGAYGWEYGENPWVNVTVTPSEGPVETITLSWSRDE